MRLLPVFACAFLFVPLPSALRAQTRTVAMTVDDLPYVVANDTLPTPPLAAKASAANQKLLTGFARHHVPVTGFVVQKHLEDLGLASGTEILRQWTLHGFDLGNHSCTPRL